MKEVKLLADYPILRRVVSGQVADIVKPNRKLTLGNLTTATGDRSSFNSDPKAPVHRTAASRMWPVPDLPWRGPALAINDCAALGFP